MWTFSISELMVASYSRYRRKNMIRRPQNSANFSNFALKPKSRFEFTTTQSGLVHATEQAMMDAALATPERRPESARKQHLTTVERIGLATDWLQATARGSKAKVLRAWKVTRVSAIRTYKLYKGQRDGGGVINMSRAPRSGRPSAVAEMWPKVMEALPSFQRSTFGRWARAANVPVTTLRRWASKMEVRRHSRFIKPKLTPAHKAARLAFVRAQVINPHSRRPCYHDHYDVVHIDEKWFHIMPQKQTILLGPNEDPPPPPKAQHKSHVPKTMVVALSTRPQPDRGFDGKIGIFDCTELVEAQRTSKNHVAGELKEVDVPVTAKWYRKLIENEALPAVFEVMPWAGLGGRKLVIQHDGATPHTGDGNTAYWPKMIAERFPGRNIEFVVQPAQSPDLNVLDLGFFSSLQRRVDEVDPASIAALRTDIEEAYWAYDKETMERVWQALFNVYNCILQEGGGNEYLLPHTGVRKRQVAGTLEREIPVDRKAFAATAATPAN
jgi:hypothetical protein